MKKTAILLTMALMVLASGYSVFAQHDNNCVECHSIHDAKGDKIIAVAPDTKTINPATKKTFIRYFCFMSGMPYR